MANKIESLTLSMGQTFSENYVIPRYQREFVWTEREVERLLRDIYEAYSVDSSSEYFIGSTVVCRDFSGLYEVIDGQQRITTMIILISCLRDIIEESNPNSSGFIKSLISTTDNDSEGNEIYRYRVELQYADSKDALKNIADNNLKDIDFSLGSKSVRNIYGAYVTTQELVKDIFQGSVTEVRKFAAYVKDKVNLIRIETRDVDHALRIFETINSRGVGLNPMDLLKNLIFMNSNKLEFDKISENWKMAMNNIEESGEPPSRFLIYFVLAFYSDKPINENQIYNWFLENKSVYKSPLVFSGELLRASEAFKNFSEGKNADGTENNHLQSLKLMNSKSTRHLILMLAVSKKSPGVSEVIARFLENLLFVHTITATNTRNLDVRFVEWSRSVQKMQKLKEIEDFLEVQQMGIRETFSDRFREAFMAENFGVTHKTRLRYILGKMSKLVNEHAYGSSGAEGKIQTFVNRDVEVEHILPKNPSNAARKEFGDNTSISSYQNRLGNLVIIEKPLNRHLGNKAYSQKKPVYDESKFLLTKSLSGNHDVGNTMITKAVGSLEAFEKWDAASLDLRTSQLFEIAKKVWDMQPTSQISG